MIQDKNGQVYPFIQYDSIITTSVHINNLKKPYLKKHQNRRLLINMAEATPLDDNELFNLTLRVR